MVSRAFLAAILVSVLPMTARADLALPVHGPVTSGVGWRLDPFGSGKLLFHRGIDIAVPVGTPVQATRGGRVTFAGADGAYGSTVIIRHENGDSTLYGHNSSLAVKVGARVEAGTTVAYSGSSGRSTGPHVHYEVRTGGLPVLVAAKNADPAEEEKDGARPDVRQQQELKMDEAMRSIFSTIRESVPQGGKGG